MTLLSNLERAAGIEPASSAWKAEVIATIRCPQAISGGGGRIRTCEAFASDLQSDPFGHSGTPPKQAAYYMACLQTKSGAGGRNRTPDLLITSQLLYQLSYASPQSPLQRGRYTTDFSGGLQHLHSVRKSPTRNEFPTPGGIEPAAPSRPGIAPEKRGRILYDFGGM